jgi:hypothetical protein
VRLTGPVDAPTCGKSGQASTSIFTETCGFRAFCSNRRVG